MGFGVPEMGIRYRIVQSWQFEVELAISHQPKDYQPRLKFKTKKV